MTPPTGDETAAALRDWARGLYPLEAATELLIRAGWARSTAPWVVPLESRAGGYGLDFAAIPGHIGALSGGEQRLLLLAAQLSGTLDLEVDGPMVGLGDCLPGLDRGTVDLVLAAVSHASGAHEHRDRTGHPSGALHPWPAR